MNDFLKLGSFYIGLLMKNKVILQCACILYTSSKRTNFAFLLLIKVVGKGKIIIWFYQLRIMYIGHCIEILKLIFRQLPLHWLLWWRANAWNVSFRIYFLWLINITNPVYKTKLSSNTPSPMQDHSFFRNLNT